MINIGSAFGMDGLFRVRKVNCGLSNLIKNNFQKITSQFGATMQMEVLLIRIILPLAIIAILITIVMLLFNQHGFTFPKLG